MIGADRAYLPSRDLVVAVAKPLTGDTSLRDVASIFQTKRHNQFRNKLCKNAIGIVRQRDCVSHTIEGKGRKSPITKQLYSEMLHAKDVCKSKEKLKTTHG